MFQRNVPLTPEQQELHAIYLQPIVAKLAAGGEAGDYYKHLHDVLIAQAQGAHDVTVAARLVSELPDYLGSVIAQFVKTSDMPENSPLAGSVKVEAYAAMLPHLMRVSDVVARSLPALTFRFMMLPPLSSITNSEQHRMRVNEYYHALLHVELKERDNPPLSVPENTAYAVLSAWKLIHEATQELYKRTAKPIE